VTVIRRFVRHVANRVAGSIADRVSDRLAISESVLCNPSIDDIAFPWNSC
jgi:hypothetical protein